MSRASDEVRALVRSSGSTLAASGQRMFVGSETVGRQRFFGAGMAARGEFNTENLRWRAANEAYGNRLMTKTRLYRFDKHDGAPMPPWEKA